MTYHTVKQGESVSSIAKKDGLADWRFVYDNDKNSELKKKRPNANVLMPGDHLFIPEKVKKHVTCQTEKVQKFKLHLPIAQLCIVVKDKNGKLYKNKKYRLMVPGKLDKEGLSSNAGLIEYKVPADASQGKLFVWLDGEEHQPYIWSLKMRCLDPMDTTSGVQGRLHNLGFDTGPIDGKQGSKTTAAIRAFQEEHDLTVDGCVGPQLCKQLEREHGC